MASIVSNGATSPQCHWSGNSLPRVLSGRCKDVQIAPEPAVLQLLHSLPEQERVLAIEDGKKLVGDMAFCQDHSASVEPINLCGAATVRKARHLSVNGFASSPYEVITRQAPCSNQAVTMWLKPLIYSLGRLYK